MSFRAVTALFTLSLMALALAACGPDDSTAPGDAVSFSADVQPIFEQHCSACHIDAAHGGLSLASYEDVTTTGEHAPIVDPGNAMGSFLLVILRSEAMAAEHADASLSAEEIQTITRWVEQGALDN